MRILLDECVPRPLRRELVGNEVHTVPEMGWAGKKNGELLGLALGAGFEVLLTTDRSLPRQQNLAAAGLAVIVLAAATNRLADLVPLMPQVRQVLPTVKSGQVLTVQA